MVRLDEDVTASNFDYMVIECIRSENGRFVYRLSPGNEAKFPGFWVHEAPIARLADGWSKPTLFLEHGMPYAWLLTWYGRRVRGIARSFDEKTNDLGYSPGQRGW